MDQSTPTTLLHVVQMIQKYMVKDVVGDDIDCDLAYIDSGTTVSSCGRHCPKTYVVGIVWLTLSCTLHSMNPSMGHQSDSMRGVHYIVMAAWSQKVVRKLVDNGQELSI